MTSRCLHERNNSTAHRTSNSFVRVVEEEDLIVSHSQQQANWETTMPLLRPELVRRITWEAGIVERKFPGRFRLRRSLETRLVWEGTVPVEGRDVPVLVKYPESYPGQPPV